MKKIKIVRTATLKDLESKINKLLAKDWKTKGKMIYVEDFYYQYMKKSTFQKESNTATEKTTTVI